MMHATKMQLAFVSAPSVNMSNPLGKRILNVLSAQYTEMEAEMKKEQRKAFLRRTIFGMLPKEPGELLIEFFIRAEEAVTAAYAQEGLI
jgi:hypothetical protein